MTDYSNKYPQIGALYINNADFTAPQLEIIKKLKLKGFVKGSKGQKIPINIFFAKQWKPTSPYPAFNIYTVKEEKNEI